MTRLLFFLAVAMFIVWLIRQRFSASRPVDKRPHRSAPGQPNEMVACLQCHIHLPLNDAVRGARGHYCSEGHRQQAEDR